MMWSLARSKRIWTSSGDLAETAALTSTARRRIGSASPRRRCAEQDDAQVAQGPGQHAAVLGAVGEVLGEPLGQRQLAAQVGLGVGEPAGVLLDQGQAVERPGQRLAVPRHGGELGDQLLEHLDGPAVVRLGVGSSSPSSRRTQPRASMASARSLRASACLASAAAARSSSAIARS